MPSSTRLIGRILVLVGAVAALACGGSTNPKPARARFSANDPAGDTVDQASDDTIVSAIDVRRVSGYTTADSLVLSLAIHGAIAAAGSGQPNSVAAIIELDIDQDPTTGIPAFLNPFGTDPDLGVERLIIVPSVASNTAAEVEDLVALSTSTYPVVYDGDSLTVRIPLTALTTIDAPIRLTAVVGTLQRPTDVVPNDGFLEIGRVSGVSADRVGAPVRGASRPLGAIVTPWTRPDR